MELTRHLPEIAGRFALGSDPTLVGAVERGELGQVRRLVTSNGSWALKVQECPVEDEVQGPARFQEAAVTAGVPAPEVIRTDAGRVLLELDGVAVRVYTWVDIQPPSIHLDPAQVGQVLASMHRLDYPSVGNARPWYTEPVGGA
jgi:Ser/Thr protein kinase RdoA (MazF antagonist)